MDRREEEDKKGEVVNRWWAEGVGWGGEREGEEEGKRREGESTRGGKRGRGRDRSSMRREGVGGEVEEEKRVRGE